MTGAARFDLSNLAQHDVAQLAGRVRACGARGGAFADIARAIVDALWDAFDDRAPPSLGIAAIYRLHDRAVELAAARTLDGGDAPAAIARELLDRLGASCDGVVFVTDPVENPLVGGRELALRYGLQTVVMIAAPFERDRAIALAIYARVAIAADVAEAFRGLALAASIALAEADDVDRDDAGATATRNLGRLLDITQAAFARSATALASQADAQRRRADELTLELAADAAAGVERLQRTQRAMLNVIEDLREARVQLEQRVADRTRELQHAIEQAHLANRAKDEFLAMLSHELRNPLAPILTALELMRMRAPDVSTRERAVIERQTQHLAALIEDLLDVSRIARGKVELRRSRVLIVDVVAKAIETAAPLFEQQRHELVISVPRDLTVHGDPARLAQVFANLLTNAAKYTDPGGRIVVSARTVDGDILVRVADNGRGISADMLPRVFDLFSQERQNLDRSRGGLGLGLAIVRSLVELHGGRIAVASDGPGHGSTFDVYLPPAPIESVPESTSAARVPATPDARGGTVLIVDDNRDAATMLADLLEARGYRTHVAYAPLDALRLADELVPDVAILDIGLPVMDGYELARRLRDIPSWRGVKLLSLSGYGQEPDRVRSREAGFHEHLVKPIDLATLELQLRRRDG